MRHLQAVLEHPLHCDLGSLGCSVMRLGSGSGLVDLGLLQRPQDHISHLCHGMQKQLLLLFSPCL
jgi:hypothetical protein